MAAAARTQASRGVPWPVCRDACRPPVTILPATCRIRLADDADQGLWDSYVEAHVQSTAYHQFAWRDVVQSAYGHRPCYLIAIRPAQSKEVLGILPLFHLK